MEVQDISQKAEQRDKKLRNRKDGKIKRLISLYIPNTNNKSSREKD